MSGIRAARRIVQAAQQVLRLAAQVVKHLVKQYNDRRENLKMADQIIQKLKK